MRNVKAALEKSAEPRQADLARGDRHRQQHGGAGPPGRPHRLATSTSRSRARRRSWRRIDPVERLRRVHELMAKELEVLAMQQEISSQAKGEMDRSQREFFLRQQLKAIQSELGEGNELGRGDRAAPGEGAEGQDAEAGAWRRWSASSRSSSACTPTPPRRRRCATGSTGWSTLPWGKATQGQPRPRRGAEDPRRGPLRPREGQGAHRRVPGGAQAQGQDRRARCSASSARPASARPRSAARSRARSAASSCACRWAA